MKFLVIEIQTNANGAVSYLVDTFDSQALAEQKYFLVLSAAAVSSIPIHTAVLLTNTGATLEKRVYTHTPEPDET